MVEGKGGSSMTQTSDGVTRCHWPLWTSHVNLSVFTWPNNCPLLFDASMNKTGRFSKLVSFGSRFLESTAL